MRTTESQVGGLPANVSSVVIANARRGAHEADVAFELRREFKERGLFTQAMTDDYGVVSEMPLGIVSSAVFKSRADEAAAKANLEAVQASLATPVVVEEPVVAAPAVVEELPPTPEEHAAAVKAAAKAKLDEAANAALAEIEARRAAKACTVVSRPTAPVSRPAPAPKVERVPGKDECYCLACPKRHVVATKDTFVHSAAWLETHFDGRPPTLEELVELAVCGQAARADRRLNWYPMMEVHAGIQKWVAAKAAADESDRLKREARLARFAPKAAQKPVVAPSPNARGETRVSLDSVGGWKALGSALGKK